MLKDKDQQIVEHILEYCSDIKSTIQRCGNSEYNFLNDRIYKNAGSMALLQIGELAKNFSKEFTEKYNEIPWKEVCRNRDYIAHHYSRYDQKMAWQTMKEDIPKLEKYCKKIFKENQIAYSPGDREKKIGR